MLRSLTICSWTFQQLYYDDDDTEDGGELQKVTIQIKEVVDEIKEDLELQKIEQHQANNNNNTLSSNAEQKLNEFYTQFNTQAKKYEEDIKLLHNKIDNLTVLVSRTLPVSHRISKKEFETSNDPISHFEKLPSIYDLKPNMFSQLNKNGKTD